MAARDIAATPTIFTSSGGDGDTIHEILKTLAAPKSGAVANTVP